MTRGGKSDSKRQSLRADERAIEGLPIRLIIALFVGLVALGLMLQVLGIFDEDQLDTSEGNILIESGEVVDELNSQSASSDTIVTFSIVDGNGETVTAVDRVLLQPDTALGETVTVNVTDGTGNLTEEKLFGNGNEQANARLRSDQTEGSFEISLVESDASEFDQVETGVFTILG